MRLSLAATFFISILLAAPFAYGQGLNGFLYSGGVYTTVDYPGSSSTQAFDINNLGQIVGVFSNNGFDTHGFSYNGTTFSSIDYPGATDTSVSGISSAGQVVGNYRIGGGSWIGFSYDGTSFSAFNYPGALGTYANDINNTGQIVGFYVDSHYSSHSFLYSGGSFSPIDYPGATITNVTGINDNGQIIGNCFYGTCSNYGQGFLYDGTTFTSSVLGGFNISNDGKIAGTDNTGAFLYAGGTYSYLNYPGALNTYAYGVNDSGQVVGEYYGGPVPEPSGIALLGSGALCMLGVIRRKLRH